MFRSLVLYGKFPDVQHLLRAPLPFLPGVHPWIRIFFPVQVDLRRCPLKSSSLSECRQGVPAVRSPQRSAEADPVRFLAAILQATWVLRDVSLEIDGANAWDRGPERRRQDDSPPDDLRHHQAQPTARSQVSGRVAPILALGAGFDPHLSGHRKRLIGGANLRSQARRIQKALEAIRNSRISANISNSRLKLYSRA